MTKKQLFVVIVVVFAAIFYIVFTRTQIKQEAVDAASSPQEIETVTGVTDEVAVSKEDTQDPTKKASKTIILTGVFVGLLEARDTFEKKYTYLLLNDGTKVSRIDLRPLIGYSNIDINKKLGVERGSEIQISGIVIDGVFTVEKIE